MSDLSRNYQRIETAITYIRENFKAQPSLDEVAAQVNLSPYHFQKLFTEWAGVSPKKFTQYLSVEYAKSCLKKPRAKVLDVAAETGLSGAGRLHDLFVHIEGMTPGEYKKGGQGLTINYSFADSAFGPLIIASTNKGICHLFFIESQAQGLKDLHKRFPLAEYHPQVDAWQRAALKFFAQDWEHSDPISLYLAGTPFQLKIWSSLLKVPSGSLASYGSLAKAVGNPQSARAVGTAIGRNPIAFLIPCHRVIQSNGNIGGYMWGSDRKSAMLAWEAAKLEEEEKASNDGLI